MEGKKAVRLFFVILISFLLVQALINYAIDPYFHYHAPLDRLEYIIDNERYQNNGIIKNFTYDAMITGTSMTENFKTSEFDELFACHSIKVPFSGASYKELAMQIKTGIEKNKNLKYVLASFDYDYMLVDKDMLTYTDYPNYLYDDNILNDYRYLFSGMTLKKSYDNIVYTLQGNKTTSFDDYANWNDLCTFGKASVLAGYARENNKKVEQELSLEEEEKVRESIRQNFIENINQNPDITFYYFVAPYSIAWWDQVSQAGNLKKYFRAEEIVIPMLLECPNVKLYFFNTNFDLTCNLDNYKDLIHYSEQVNSQILKWIKNDEYLLTRENYQEYLEKGRNFYMNYDYSSIFV